MSLTFKKIFTKIIFLSFLYTTSKNINKLYFSLSIYKYAYRR